MTYRYHRCLPPKCASCYLQGHAGSKTPLQQINQFLAFQLTRFPGTAETLVRRGGKASAFRLHTLSETSVPKITEIG